MTYNEYWTMTTGQILDIIDDKGWWLRRQGAGVTDAEPPTPGEVEEMRERARKKGWI